jgi:hypothetical protein
LDDRRFNRTAVRSKYFNEKVWDWWHLKVVCLLSEREVAALDFETKSQ